MDYKYKNKLSLKNKINRFIWMVISLVLFRPFPSRFFRKWRVLVLRFFGADIPFSSSVHASVKIWAPWNLIMGENSCISDNVDCYNVDKVILENNVTISQRSFLCTASHDIRSIGHELITAPIKIKNNAWVTAETYIGMNVTVGEYAVIGARTVVVNDVPAFAIVAGNPARIVGKRVFNNK